MTMQPKKITILGSGNWGSAIAKVIGTNVQARKDLFDQTVKLWVYEEIFEGRRLSEMINTEHENKKYLPGIILPKNVVAITDSVEASIDADMIFVVLPHQFVNKVCTPLKGKIKSDCLAISLIKGVDVSEQKISLFSDVISETLGITTGVLSGANVANEIALERYCESTLAFTDKNKAKPFVEVLESSFFKIDVISDVAGAQLCGALKNVVAIAAGTVDGLGLGPNTKAAVIRMGLVEMNKFIKTFFPDTESNTMFESCGVADLIVTCYAGRNRLAAETHAKTGKDFKLFEKEHLSGQSLQGTTTSKEIYEFLSHKRLLGEYPLFTTVHKICNENMDPKNIILFFSGGVGSAHA